MEEKPQASTALTPASESATVDTGTTQATLTASTPLVPGQSVTTVPRKEGKIRVDTDIPVVMRPPTSGLGLSSQPTAPQPLQEWEQASIRLALGSEDEKEDKKSVPLARSTPAASRPPITSAASSSSGTTSALDTPSATHSPGPQFPALRQALQSHYRQASHLKLPLSEQRFPIKDVSLTISDKSEQDRARARREAKAKDTDAKSDEKEKKSSTEFWSPQFRLEEEWHRISQPIAVKDLFTLKDSQTPTKRILVEGRAGVGKTTFSQYLAHQWAEHNLFASRFDYVFRIPLRQCLATEGASTRSSMEAHIAAFIFDKQIPQSERTKVRPQEIETVLSGGSDSRTLLILDGFDEVAHQLSDSGQPFHEVLKDLLHFHQVIVTTRDYQTPPEEFQFERRLVNIGFTDQQIQDYIDSYFAFLAISTVLDEKDKKEKPAGKSPVQTLQTALKQNPRLWGLAHVPLNLALICEVYAQKSLPAKKSAAPSFVDISLMHLYQKVLECFLLRQLSRQGVKLEVYDWQSLQSRHFITLDALSLLAWEAFDADAIVFSAKIQKAALSRLRQRYPEATDIEDHFSAALELGLLQGEGGMGKNRLEQSRYFIHLTFQEYFTAYYLLQNLQGYYGKAAYDESLAWLGQHKYEPRYAVVMGFLAGFTTQPGYDQALATFWHTVLSPPHDMIGAAHFRLVVRCLEEAQLDKRIPARDKLLEMMQGWIDYEVSEKWIHHERHITRDWDDMLGFIDYLCLHPRVLSESGVKERLLKRLQDEKPNVRGAAAKAIGEIGAVAPSTEELVPSLLRALQDEDKDVRMAAVKALESIGAVAPSTEGLVPGLLQALQDKRGIVRRAAACILREIGAVAPGAEGLVSGLLRALQDEEWLVRRAAATALGKIGALAPSTEGLVSGLLQALQDKKEDVRSAATDALEKIGALALGTEEGLVPSLLQALQDEDEYVKYTAADALGKIGAVAPSAEGLVSSLLRALQDEDKDVRMAAVKALGKIGAVAPSTAGLVPGLLRALQDKDEYVRSTAAHALEPIGAIAPDTEGLVPGLLRALQDKKGDVRGAATDALGKIGTVAPSTEELVPSLLWALQDEDEEVRHAATDALGKIGTVAPSTEELVPSLLQALQDEDKDVRMAAVKALGKIGALAPSTAGLVPSLLQALQDENEEVRHAAAAALGEIGAVAPGTEELVPGLLRALQDKDEDVRSAAADALGKMGAVAPSTEGLVPGLLRALQDKDEDEDFRRAAADALEKIGAVASSTEGLVSGLLQALQGGKWRVRDAAADALGKIGTVAPSTEELIPGLLRALQDKRWDVRSAAAAALGPIGAVAPSTEGLVSSLLRALQDENEKVRGAAVAALGKIGAVAPSTEELVPGLLRALQDKDEDVRSTAAHALEPIGAVAPDTTGLVPGLLQALQDEDDNVGRIAKRALHQTFTQLTALFAQHLAFTHQARLNHQDINPVWMDFILQRLIETFPGVILHADHLQLITGAQSTTLALPDQELMQPLFMALQEKYQEFNLPAPPTLEACQGKTPLYPAAKKPDFKPGILPKLLDAPKPLDKKSDKSTPAKSSWLDSSGQITLDFKVRHQDLTYDQPSLGKGGAGEVFRGKYKLETVAIKRFLLQDFSRETQAEMRQEASLMALIQSGHLVRLRGICLEKPNYCVVMDYFPQGDLHQLLSNPKKPLSWTQRYRLAADIATGVYHLHQNGILHRDLKSLNVLLQEVDGELRAKVADFGFAVFKRNLKTSDPKGTLLWTDPGMLLGTLDASRETDIYSLGLVLYELASRQLPFYALHEKPDALRKHILSGQCPVLPAECPAGLAELIQSCWSKDPKQRPSALVVAERLEALYQTAKQAVGTVLPRSKSSELVPASAGAQDVKPTSEETTARQAIQESLKNLPQAPSQPASALFSLPAGDSSVAPTAVGTQDVKPMSEETTAHQAIATSKKDLLAFTPTLPAQTPPQSSSSTFHKELERLCTESDYTFSLRRTRADALRIQFTASDQIFADESDIKKELLTLGNALKTVMAGQGIILKPNQFKPEWKKWTLTLNAEATTLNKIIQLMIQAGAKYLPSDTKSKLGFFPPPATTPTTPLPTLDESAASEVNCGVQ